MPINTNKIYDTELHRAALRGAGCLNFSFDEKSTPFASQKNNVVRTQDEILGVSLPFEFICPAIITNTSMLSIPEYYSQQCKKCKGTFA